MKTQQRRNGRALKPVKGRRKRLEFLDEPHHPELLPQVLVDARCFHSGETMDLVPRHRQICGLNTGMVDVHH